MDKNDLLFKRLDIEKKQRWHERMGLIPFIQFPSDWKIKPIPPFQNVFTRFLVLLPSGLKKSVYLDLDSSCGLYTNIENKLIPYWEVCPYRDDTGRCEMNDIPELLRLIGDEK